MSSPEKLCEQINHLLNTLPPFKKPREVPFNNGLYFFYENGEVSKHAPEGRIVRIGNHPLSQDSLKRRLRMHYSGGKNGSVFRRLLGGAILHKTNPGSACLQHWEKQGMHTCENCKPIENKVRELLKSNFSFRCIEIENRPLRNSFEEKLIATISLCPICKPSDSWLGKYAYSDKVKLSGLWNSDYVFDQAKTLTNQELVELERIIKHTINIPKPNRQMHKT
jgi:hypothetical protein